MDTKHPETPKFSKWNLNLDSGGTNTQLCIYIYIYIYIYINITYYIIYKYIINNYIYII